MDTKKWALNNYKYVNLAEINTADEHLEIALTDLEV